MMRHINRFCFTMLLLGIAVIPAAAQDGIGVYPVEDLGILDQGNLEVDINLQGSTLLIAAGALQDQDPRLRDLVSNLTRVRVQVGSVESRDSQVVADRVNAAVAQLEAQGWVRVLRVESDNEQIYVYSIDGSDGNLAGLTVLVNDGGDEAVVANLAGSIDPVLLGSMMSHLGDMDLSQFIPGDPDEG